MHSRLQKKVGLFVITGQNGLSTCNRIVTTAGITMATNSIKLLTGNSYPELARLVADRYVQSANSIASLA